MCVIMSLQGGGTSVWDISMALASGMLDTGCKELERPGGGGGQGKGLVADWKRDQVLKVVARAQTLPLPPPPQSLTM